MSTPSPDVPTKLVMMVVADTDADALMDTLVEQGHATTKVGSTGGFLHHGSVTIFCGVGAADVDAVLATVREICRARREFVPIPGAIAEEGPFNAEPIEVRVGGAIVFVLDIDRFERV